MSGGNLRQSKVRFRINSNGRVDINRPDYIWTYGKILNEFAIQRWKEFLEGKHEAKD